MLFKFVLCCVVASVVTVTVLMRRMCCTNAKLILEPHKKSRLFKLHSPLAFGKYIYISNVFDCRCCLNFFGVVLLPVLCVCICPSNYLCLCVCLSVCMYVCMYVCLCACVCLSVWLAVWLSGCLVGWLSIPSCSAHGLRSLFCVLTRSVLL